MLLAWSVVKTLINVLYVELKLQSRLESIKIEHKLFYSVYLSLNYNLK